jgi:hypothetical protein
MKNAGDTAIPGKNGGFRKHYGNRFSFPLRSGIGLDWIGVTCSMKSCVELKA